MTLLLRVAVVLCLLALSAAAKDPPLTVEVDFRRELGPFARLSGVQGAPCPMAPGDTNHIEEFRRFHIEFCRFPQDCEPNTLTLAAIFPDPRANPDDPSSYHFDAIDHHIKATRSAGCQVLWQTSYDVGMSDSWKGFNLGGRAPRDLKLWGRVVTHCLEHFNNGWAAGQKGGVSYAEFVNEPDGLGGFTGRERERLAPSFLEFLKVIEAYTAAHPDTPVQAVGPGVPLSWDQWPTFEMPMRRLLQQVQKEHGHLPIFSFHTYGNDTSPGANQRLALALRQTLDAQGMTSTRLWNSEWQATDFIRQLVGGRRKTGQSLSPELVHLYQRAVAAYALACKIRWQGVVDYSCYYIAVRRCFPTGHGLGPEKMDTGIFFPPRSSPTLLAEQEKLTWETARLYPERCHSTLSPDDGRFSALAMRSQNKCALLLSNPSISPRIVHLSLQLRQPVTTLTMRWTELGGASGTTHAQGEGTQWRLEFPVPQAGVVLMESGGPVGSDEPDGKNSSHSRGNHAGHRYLRECSLCR